MDPRSRGLAHIGSLRPFLALDDLEFNLVAFLQTFVTITGNGAIVDEYIRSAFTPQEAVPFRVVKPLNGAFYTFHLFFSLSSLTLTSLRLR